jgi:hypothetical protein
VHGQRLFCINPSAFTEDGHHRFLRTLSEAPTPPCGLRSSGQGLAEILDVAAALVASVLATLGSDPELIMQRNGQKGETTKQGGGGERQGGGGARILLYKIFWCFL